MKLIFRSIIIAFFLAQSLFALEEKNQIDALGFENSQGHPFFLIPFHELGEERVSQSLFALFQDERVAQYYEKGMQKTLPECTAIYQRIAPRFQDWNRDQLGGVAIINEQGEFQGFIAAYIYKEQQPYHIEVAIALNSDVQRTKIATRGLKTFFSHYWPKLTEEVRAQIGFIKSPINPRNLASKGLSEYFFSNSVREDCYVPPYYNNIPREKGERVTSLIPIDDLLKLIQSDKF